MKGSFLLASHSLGWLILRKATAMSRQHCSSPERGLCGKPGPSSQIQILVVRPLQGGLLTAQSLHWRVSGDSSPLV